MSEILPHRELVMELAARSAPCNRLVRVKCVCICMSVSIHPSVYESVYIESKGALGALHQARSRSPPSSMDIDVPDMNIDVHVCCNAYRHSLHCARLFLDLRPARHPTCRLFVFPDVMVLRGVARPYYTRHLSDYMRHLCDYMRHY